MRCISAVLLTMLLLISSVAIIDFSSADDDEYFSENGRSYMKLDADNVSLTYILDEYATQTITVGPTVTHSGHTYNIKKIQASIDCPIIEYVILDSVVLEDVDGGALIGRNIRSIAVNGSNPYLVSDGGVLYNKLQTKLIRYPTAKEGNTFNVPISVSEISSYAFYGSTLRTITITGETLTNIGPSAFSGCGLLESVGSGGNLPESLVMIGSCAFCYCTSMSSLSLPDSVIYIGSYAFSGSGLSSIKIPYSVDYIGECAFSDCTDLEEFESECDYYKAIDGVLYHISGDDDKRKTLFCYPAGRVNESFTILDDVVNISPSAFSGTVKLKTIVLPANMVSIPNMAFAYCESLENIDLKNVSIIGNEAFYNCTGLKSVIFSDSLLHIGYSAFENTSIETVTLPSSITSMDESVFYGCTKLTKVTIEESARFTIMENTFFGCSSLNELTINSKDVILEEESLSIGSEGDNVTLNLNVPSGFIVPDNVANEDTTLVITYIGERPYPWVNIIGAIVCALGIIGILYGMRQV